MATTRLDLIENSEDFLKLEADWKGLLENCEHSFFQTWEYTSLWVKHYGAEVQFRVLVLRDGLGVAHGIAPFILTAGAGRVRKHLVHLTLLGGLCESLAEYLDFLIEPGWEEEFHQAVGHLLLQEDCFEADSVYFELVEEHSAFKKLATEGLQAVGELNQRGHYEGHYAYIPEGWDSYYAGVDKKFRQQVEKAKRDLVSQHGMVVKQAGVEISVTAAMDALIHLNQERWGGAGENVYKSAKFCAFHHELAGQAVQAGRLAMLVMEAKGQVVSVRYDFAYQGRVYAFQSGWDTAWQNYKLGQLLLRYSMQWALEGLGCREFDFMAGGWAYQRFWKNHTRTFTSFEILNPATFRGRAFLQLRKLKHRLQGAKGVTAA